MVNNFLGVTGSNKEDVTSAVEKIINLTNAKTDQENIQMNIIVGNDLRENIKSLTEMGSKEILVIGSVNETGDINLNIKLLSINDIDYVVNKYRNDNYE